MATPENPFHPALEWDVFPPMALPEGSLLLDVTDIDPRPGVGWAYDGETFTAPEARAEPELSEVQTLAKTIVDEKAEDLRLQMLTPGEGQAQAYAEKTAELAAYDAVIAAQRHPSGHRLPGLRGRDRDCRGGPGHGHGGGPGPADGLDSLVRLHRGPQAPGQGRHRRGHGRGRGGGCPGSHHLAQLGLIHGTPDDRPNPLHLPGRGRVRGPDCPSGGHGLVDLPRPG